MVSAKGDDGPKVLLMRRAVWAAKPENAPKVIR